MAGPASELSEREQRFGEIAFAYLRAAEEGRRPAREEWLARYPEFAEELAGFLDNQQAVDRVAAPLREIAGAASPPAALTSRPDAAAGDWPAPDQLGGFRLLREVGRGGMGIVFEAEQESLGRRVALKVLPFAAAMDPRHLQRFKNEAQAAAQLHHTNIVPVHYVGCERGVHFYAMQFIEGRTLAAVIAELRQQTGPQKADQDSRPEGLSAVAEALASGHLAPPSADPQQTTAYAPPPVVPARPSPETTPRAGLSTEHSIKDRAFFRGVAQLGIQAAEALDHAHQQGVVHRDIKPANLLVDGQGKVWVTDFGLAQIQSDTRLTRTGDLVGTLRYMSPEQALAKRVVVDHRTDIYSLGATLYELLTLEPACTGSDRQELLRQIAFEEPARPRRLNRAVPAELETIVLKALEKNPVERYGTAQELADDLRRFLDGRLIRARRPTLWQRARKWAGRHRYLVGSAAAVLALAVIMLAGSVGWVARDRAARQREAEGKVLEALKAAVPRLRDGNPHDPALIAAVERAEAQLAGDVLGAELRRQVEQLRRDHQMLRQLEQALLKGASGSALTTGLDALGADRLFTQAFAEYGLDVSALGSKVAADRIRASAIRAPLVAALDTWIFFRVESKRGSGALLREVASLADDDPWTRRLRRAALRGDVAGLENLAKQEGPMNQASTNLVLLALALRQAKRWEQVERLLRRAQLERPTDFWINLALANTLYHRKPPDLAEAARFYQAALCLRSQSASVYNDFGAVLWAQGKLAQAEAAFRKAILLKPDPGPFTNLGVVLRDEGKLAEAEAVCRKAIQLAEAGAVSRSVIQLMPKLAGAHLNLGTVLKEQGKLAEAETAFRNAIQIKPDYADAHSKLGEVLKEQRKLAEAEAACRKTVQLAPDSAGPYIALGMALNEQGKLAEAEAAYRKAIQLEPRSFAAHYDRGNNFRDNGQLDAAAAEYREAIRLKNEYAQAHCSLGGILVQKGQFAAALVYLRRGHELGSKNPRWSYPSRAWVRWCERLFELDRKLPAILNGRQQPTGVAERIGLAELCQMPCKKRYLAAFRFYKDAFAADPKLISDQPSLARYNAACAAALAGCGQGEGADKLGAAQRERLRRQSLDWLRADLAAWRRALEKEPDKTRTALLQQLAHWQVDSDLSGVRGDALAKLPAAQRQAWQQLWADVADTLARAQGKTAPAKKPGPK
jgi:serine/threonine protein kinase/Tfp pilus assembly protein PilF